MKDEDSPCVQCRETISDVYRSFDLMDRRIRDIEQIFSDGQRAAQIGVQNVYDKFTELEKRQKEIEDFLKSDRVMEVVKLIPKEDDIMRMLKKIDSSAVVRLKKKIYKIREDLDELSDRFTF